MSIVDVNWRPDRRVLRSFGLTAALLLAAVAAWVGWRHTLPGLELSEVTAGRLAWILCISAVVVGSSALLRPRMVWPLYVLLTAIGLPIGLVVSFVALALVYFLLITPIALVFRIVGRDPLQRKFEPMADTYWTARRPSTDVKRHFRMF
ncbi:MAG: SxtJ family membrane protein [Planctomycetota bacterium]